MGRDNEFCKHCVAAGLAWIHRAQSENTMDDVAAWLNSQTKDLLLELIIRQAMNDDRLFCKLLLKASRSGRSDVNIAAFKRLIHQAICVNDYTDCRDVNEYIRGVEEVIDSIEELLDEGFGPAVLDLVDYALDAFEDPSCSIDHPEEITEDLIWRLIDIHHAACISAGIDPIELAKRLFEREMHSCSGIFSDPEDIYADVLGEAGIEAYHKLVETAENRGKRG